MSNCQTTAVDKIRRSLKAGGLRRKNFICKISDWKAAMNHLYPKDKDRYDKYTSQYIFRGERKRYPDVSSLFQREFVSKDKKHAEPHIIEAILLENFQKYASYIPEYRGFGFWEWMMIARHYELPTRLIDFSSSPLTALYNATLDVGLGEKAKDDGIVWAINIDHIRESCHFFPRRIKKQFRKADRKQLTIEMLKKLKLRSFNKLEKCIGPRGSVPLIIDPPTLDPRIMHQFGCFLCFSNRKTRMDEWLMDIITAPNAVDLLFPNGKNREPLFKIFVIKKKAKREIFDKLHMSNVTPRILSPGLAGIAKTLHHRYCIIKKKD
jgi:hypothetical protein